MTLPRRRRVLSGLLAACVLLAAGSCRDVLEADRVAEVEVQAAAPEVAVGDSLKLHAVVRTASGRPLDERPVQWSSSDPELATIDSLGWLRARRPGTVTATATLERVSGQRTITVRHRPVSSLNVAPQGHTVGIGRIMRLTAVALGTGGPADTIPDVSVTWSSSDTSVVKVHPNGDALGVGNGSAVVTTMAGGRSATATVLTGVPVGRIYLSPPWDLQITPGTTRQLEASLYQGGVGAQPMVEGRRLVVWSSSDERVATVSASGLVRAVAPGAATITATSEGVSASLGAVVIGSAATVEVATRSATLTAGSSVTLEFRARDANGQVVPDAQFTVTSSDPAVAFVREVRHVYGGSWQATVTALARGTARIAMRTGALSDTTLLTVISAVASVQVQPDTATLQPGGSRQFRAVLRAVDGEVLEGRPVTWASTNLGVAAIDAAGLVTAVGPGTTTIVAMAEGRTGTARVTVPGSVATSGRWIAVTAGNGHSCALDTGGRSYCWGRNHLAQLGTGTRDSTAVPLSVAGGPAFTQVHAAGSGTCGISGSGEVFCWVNANWPEPEYLQPRRVAAGRTFRSVHAGGTYNQACGVETAGDLYCWAFWSSAGWSELARPGPFRQVSASPPCALGADGQVTCWGQRSTGTYSPGGVPGDPVELSGGGHSACVRDAAGRAYCTTSYSVGVGGSFGIGPFEPVPGQFRFAQISAGGREACGVTAEGRAYCWSTRAAGGGPTYRITLGEPAPVAEHLRFARVSAGAEHSCGVTVEGAAFCWGDNRWGQLGVGVLGGTSAEPARVMDP